MKQPITTNNTYPNVTKCTVYRGSIIHHLVLAALTTAADHLPTFVTFTAAKYPIPDILQSVMYLTHLNETLETSPCKIVSHTSLEISFTTYPNLSNFPSRKQQKATACGSDGLSALAFDKHQLFGHLAICS